MQRFVLLNLKTSGLKSLEQEIEIQFCNKDLSNFPYNSPLIKAIYGTNGEGKTAIALTLDLYRNSIINGEYLAAQSFNSDLSELINKNSKKVYIDLYFAALLGKSDKIIYHHIIEYKLIDKRLYVSYEKISECNGDIWGNKSESVLFETKDGVVVDGYKKDHDFEEIKNRTINLLSGSSAAFPIVVKTEDMAMNSKGISIRKNPLFAAMSIIMFALSLNVFIDKEDQLKVSSERVSQYVRNYNVQFRPSDNFNVNDEEDIIEKDVKSQYEKEIGKIEKLIKVFRPDLKHIDLHFNNIGGDKLSCKKTLVYNNGEFVDLEYESTGVKKLVRLFNVLNSVDKGGVVFIDEFDANIHDVYLCKLIEYFADFSNGQLIFTTHNLGPMEVLDKKELKHSIDFINKQKITSWKKNGNYSVVRVYRNGMIPNSPFNINSVDFVKVFGGKR